MIEQLLADPRRIVQARSQLHLGQHVKFLHWDDGKWRAARVVSMKNDRVTVLDEASGKHLSVPYAAIMTTDSAAAEAGTQARKHLRRASPLRRRRSRAAKTSV